jgi:twitching motility protein PilI
MASKLGVQVGAQSWLVDLTEAGEVMPAPPVTPVPLSRPWFRGVANVRGNLYSVIDFAAFLGAGGVAAGEHARLLLLGERFRSGAGLLIDRALGLRNPAHLRAREGSGSRPAWVRGEFEDESGTRWSELDVAALVRDNEFLSVAM